MKLRTPGAESSPRSVSTRWGHGERALGREVVWVGFLSIALAVLLQLVQIVAIFAAGADYGLPKVFRDGLLKLPWAVLVCVSLWIAIRMGRNRIRIAAVVGLLAAPVASLLARACAELAHAYMAAAAPAPSPSAFLVAALKGAEYASLALVVTWLQGRVWAAALHHALAGFLVGLLFGGALLVLIVRFTSEPVTMATLLAWAVNELLFPVGCALILSSARPHR